MDLIRGMEIKDFLINGGTVIVDNKEELINTIRITNEVETVCHVGLRVNYDIGNNKISRFGIDAESDNLWSCINIINKTKNLTLDGLQCHIGGARSIDDWKYREEFMLSLANKIFENKGPAFIDLGSGMFGEMQEELATQFCKEIPMFEDYAGVIATNLNNIIRLLMKIKNQC